MTFSYTKNFPKSLKVFLLTKFFAYSQSAFAQFLINIYFWRITKNIPFLVLFNIFFCISHTLTYFPAGRIAKIYNRFLPMRIGTILQIFYLLLIIFLKENIVYFIVPVAIIGGVAHGFYWFSDNLLKLDLTTPDIRLPFTAIYTIIHSMANSIIPLLASILVINDGTIFHSYSRVFILGILCALVVFILSFFISSKKKFDVPLLNFRNVSKRLLKDRNVRIACVSTALSYISNVLPMLIGLLLFISSGSELSLGAYQFITVLIVAITNYIMGKYLFSRKNYRKLLFLSGITDVLFVGILIISQSYLAILIYGILKALFSFAGGPFYPLSQDAFSIYCKDDNEYAEMRIIYIILQEIFVCVGSIIGFLVVLLLHKTINPLLISIIVIIFACTDLLSKFYITKIKDDKNVKIISCSS
ncbi:MAG: MFS transporter [Candidatus Paceibacterota bacterium]|jgi:YQGE family putative transporter